MIKLTRISIIVVCLLNLTGCTTTRTQIASLPKNTFPPTAITPSEPGSYHYVRKGETLWRISRSYCIDLHELAAYNKLSEACKIEVGQKIFIPDSLSTKGNYKKTSNDNKTDFIWPCKGVVLTCFNQLKQNVRNQGIDISTRSGATVRAAASGNVVFTSENMRGYGKAIIVHHSGNFMTVYTNNQKNLVKSGDYVTQGQTIASAGSTGRTNDNIVHFELRKNNRPQNPLLYLP
ncbi:MAG: peptidoglycan DD-metalloendopeptidase family protein [Candidatus Omnitrophica bacterium]|nr:peptidoglycan DD-metalloendopeptidase family protein [Candidatus Omnitrophota bacterium]MBU4478439.1 peptidoglycan DD-metalloendopeptidase family protein [Candidatus Omnitrophota bacterium]MCG2704363.1 peptidoglycan DD-metalloendopeptidase family protein [Candidatus Omnitrophota bacterium]